MRFLRLGAALGALAALAACGGAGQSGACSNPIGVTAIAAPAMYSPAPGTTGLPTSGVVIGVTYDPPNGSLRAVAQDGTNATLAGGPFVPATSSGTSTPPPLAVTSALPTLAPHTTYRIFVDAVYPPRSPCVFGEPFGPVTIDLGTIATQ